MKATGIVRRIDDIVRIVIPKEIRCTFRIKEGKKTQMILPEYERFSFNAQSWFKPAGKVNT